MYLNKILFWYSVNTPVIFDEELQKFAQIIGNQKK